jgi:hypothetical protein
MKVYYLTLLIFSLAFKTSLAFEVDQGESGLYTNVNYDKLDTAIEKNVSDYKVTILNRQIEDQKNMYEHKIKYLETELKKSQERLISFSLNHEKAQSQLEKKLVEETSNLKRDIIAKTKSIMEYQRQLEKVKPSEDELNLIKVNTEIALALRKSTEQMALLKLRGPETMELLKEGHPESKGRMPASVAK